MNRFHPSHAFVPALPSASALRATWLAALLAAWLAGAAPAGAQTAAASPAPAASGPTLRAEAAKPLQAAQAAIQAGNYAEALARLAEAEALPGLTPYEAYIAQRLRAPAAMGAGDNAAALKALDAALASPLMPAADRPAITEAAIKLSLQQKDYERGARLMKAYFADGGSNAEIRRLYPQVLGQLGDHAGVVAQLTPVLAADEAARRATPEPTLRLMALSQNALKDRAGYQATLEKLAASTGKPDYWGEVISRVIAREGFAEERLRPDIYRLRQAVGHPLAADEVGDWAMRVNQAGLPAEAQKLLDDGFASGLLGKNSNTEADRKLRESATKAATQERNTAAESEASALKAKDGNAAFGLGLSLSGAGQHERALSLMNQGLAKGGLRRPDDAMLHLGLVQWRAGKIDDAQKTFAAVKGADGTADLARLWTLYLSSPARK